MSIYNGHARWAFDFLSWRPTIKELQLAVSILQPEEKQRISQFHFIEDFKASLAGRLLMRFFVRQAMSIDNHHFKLGRDDREKPYLIEMNGVTNWDNKILDFNVSHQGSFACLGKNIRINETTSIFNLKFILKVDILTIKLWKLTM
jgi:4'-phosphopantetheinyl transferase